MFCPQCGRALDEGKSFCPFCGSKMVEKATIVTPRAEAPAAAAAATPRMPPSGSGMPAPPGLSGPGPSGPGTSGQTGGWGQTPPPPPPGWGSGGGFQESPRRTLWVVLAVIGALIILGGGGAAAYYFLIRDDGKGTTTTVASVTTLSSTTSSGGTVTTAPGSTSTTTGDGGTSTTTASKPTSTTTAATTTTTNAIAYVQAVTALEQALKKQDARIPQLADQINATAPNVPDSVYDELGVMKDEISRLRDELTMIDPPEPWLAADGYILDASVEMEYRIENTMLGIEAMWNEGTVDAATYYFDEGRVGRDEYRRLFDLYLQAKP